MLALEPGKGKVRTLAGGELNGATEQNGTREGPCAKSQQSGISEKCVASKEESPCQNLKLEWLKDDSAVRLLGNRL